MRNEELVSKSERLSNRNEALKTIYR